MARRIAAMAFMVAFAMQAFAEKGVPKPIDGKRVYDYAHILNASEEQRLEKKLIAYQDTTSTQIVIFLDNSLEGEDAFGYTQRLAESWGIGQDAKNNGLVIAAYMKEHALRIQVRLAQSQLLDLDVGKPTIDSLPGVNSRLA